MYKYYFLILTFIVTFLIIVFINFSYYIKNKNIENFEDNCPAYDKEFVKTNVKNTCDFICNRMETPETKTNCINNCPAFAEQKILKGPSLGMDYLLKTFYKQDFERDTVLKNSVDRVVTEQAITNSKFINILGNKCSEQELIKIKDDMNKDTYGNWVKLGNLPNNYSYDGTPAQICTSDKNFVNIKDNFHFKNKDINYIINTHSIVGLSWYRFANINHPTAKLYIDNGTITEISSDYIRTQLIDKIKKGQPLTFYKAEIPLFFTETDNITYENPPKNTIIKNLVKTNFIVIDNTIYLPHTDKTPGYPVWLYSDKDIIKLRQKWIIKKDKELNKLAKVNECIYTHDDIDALPNKITHNIAGNNYEWGKIGNTDDNEYSLISDYKTQISNENNKCFIPGNLHNDVTNLPNELIDPNTQNIYGKYDILPSNAKYNSATYNFPYIDKSNLDNNIDDLCFVKKGSAGEAEYGMKQKYGGEYGLIGDWGEYLRDTSAVPEKRYGKIKTPTNNGWVGQIGSTNGKYAKIGYTYADPSGLRWVKFVPSTTQKNPDNPNIINNVTLSSLLKDSKNTYNINKELFDSLQITITENSIIKGSDNQWYKPRDIILFGSGYCDIMNNDLMEALEEDEQANFEDLLLDTTYKYYSDNKERFNSKFKDCPDICNKDSDKTGNCAPCFKNGLITIALSDWSALVNSINLNTGNLDTLIADCETNLSYTENGKIKPKNTPYQFKNLLFKKVKIKPENGNDISQNNPDMQKSKFYAKLFPRILPIDAETWNTLGIDNIGLNDYYTSLNEADTYYVIDNTSFFNIIGDYKRAYDENFEKTRKNLPECKIPYNNVDKTMNTCTTPNHVCVPKTNMSEETYRTNINKETDKDSTWYKTIYERGHDDAKDKIGKYWNNEELGLHGEECVPAENTKPTNGQIYVPENSCPANQSCKKCEECIDPTLECKTPDYLFTEAQLQQKKTTQFETGKSDAKSKFADTYDGVLQCNSKTWVPIISESGERTEIGSANACTGNKKCDDMDQNGWDNIMQQVRREKAANEEKCRLLNQDLGTNFYTCLKQNT